MADLPKQNDSGLQPMNDIAVSEEGIIKLRAETDLGPFKAMGPDEIPPPWVLKTTAQKIGLALTIIFQNSNIL